MILFIASLGLLTEASGGESMRSGEKSLCKSGKQQRSVQVQYFEQEKQVPCEVHYYKSSEEPAMGQVLWRAANEVGFCEKKMAVFLKELSGSGWDCQKNGDSVSSDVVENSHNELRDSSNAVLPPDLSSK